MYPSYLIHFNRQHDPKTGKFTYGDGDGDGIHNDHKNQNKSSLDRSARRSEIYRPRDNRTIMTTSSEKYRDTIRPALTREERPGRLVRIGDTNSGKLLLDQTNRNKTTYRQTLTREERPGQLVRVGDTKLGNYVLDQSNRGKTTYKSALTREGTGQLVRLGDTKVPNLVKGDRRENPNGDKPGRQSDGTKSKDTYTKLPGQPISRVKNTYEKVPAGPSRYKPTYDKVGTPKGGNKVSETLSNMNATLSRNFTRVNEKEHLYGPGGYDYNAPPSNGSTKYDAEQRNNSNTLKDADYYLRNNKLTNPNEDGKKLVDYARDREVDEQKVTNREATEIFVMRALGQTLHSLYIDDPDERREKNKELLERTNTKNWNK